MGIWENIVFYGGSIIILFLLLRTFVCKTVEDVYKEGTKGSEDDKIVNASILDDIFKNGFHTSSLETENSFAKYIARKASRITNIFYFILLLSAFLPFFLKGIELFYPLIAAIFLLFFVYLLHSYSKREIKEQEFKEYFIDKTSYGNTSKWHRQYLRTMILIPFSVRNIWWLILILGILGVQFETLEKSGGFEENSLYMFSGVDNKLLNEYLLEFFRIFIISIVAYIATNIIRELTLLRDKYVKGAEQAKDLNVQLKEFKPEFEKTIKSTKDSLKASEVASEIINFIDKFSSSTNKVKDKARVFLKETAVLTKSMNNSVKANDDKYIQMGLLSARTTLIANQSKRINNHHNGSVLTPWTNLGSISKNLMDDIYSLKIRASRRIEIYALQLKTPEQFIDKYVNEDEEQEEWQDFVNENIKNVISNKIIIKRYFARIEEGIFSIDDIKPKELEKLKTTGNNLSKLYQYFRDEDVKFKTKEDGNENNNKELRQILSEVVHKNNSCFIRTFNSQADIKLIYNKKDAKFIDYLAVYETDENNGNGEWLFCVKSLYDQGFDAAKVTLLAKNDGCPTWNALKENLSKIFFETDINKCKEITYY